MASVLPETPGRGRSRFSKALPTAPRVDYPVLINTDLRQSPLPPLPKDAMASKMSIPRRPVGASKSVKSPSIASLSSVYSDSATSSRRLSDSSRNSANSLSGSEQPGTEPAPPLPPKDKGRGKTASPAESPKHVLASPAAGFTSSPPRPEIWKRRSTKSERSIRFPELKLNRSNGSTTEPPTERSLPPIPFSLPRSSVRKPVPSRPAPPQPNSMGNTVSKLKEKHERKKSNGSSSGGTIGRKGMANTEQPSPVTRLPTPEYHHTDKQQPSTPQILSPRTPNTPPDEAPPPELPDKNRLRANSNSSNNSLLKLVAEHSRSPSETLTVTSEATVMASPQPQKNFATNKILTPAASPSPASALRSPESFSNSHSRSASSSQTLSPTKIYFPKQPGPLLAKGTVLPAPPLTSLQFECYQAHQKTHAIKNAKCP
ncbi:hypothetical protein LSUE1_G010177, partial [Lachnellula suecica]